MQEFEREMASMEPTSEKKAEDAWRPAPGRREAGKTGVFRKLKGLKQLVFDAIEEITNLVERTHKSVARRPMRTLKHLPGVARPVGAIIEAQQATAGVVYDTIRFVSRSIDSLVGVPLSAAAGRGLPHSARQQLVEATAIGDRPLSFFTDQAEGALNGVLGDYLHDRHNQLGFDMEFREGGARLPAEAEAIATAHPCAGNRVCIFVHGLAATEWSWNLFATQYYGDPQVNFATQLDRDLGTTSFFVRFNSGRHVSENGRELSRLIEQLVQQYPHPIEDLTLVGHSAGGLVVRSAAHYGREHGATWIDLLDRIVCIGSPHLGATLEQAANVLTSVLGFFDVPGTQVPAEILNARSDGIKDMRFGYTVDEEWVDEDPDALLENNRREVEFVDHVAYYSIAGHVTADVEHPGTWMLGDLLVRLPSAGGVSKTRRMPFRFGKVFPQMNHLHLLNHPDVYDLVKQLCQGDFDPNQQPGPTREEEINASH